MKLFLTILGCSSIILGITGCSEKDSNELAKRESIQIEEKADVITIKNPEDNYMTDEELKKIILKDANIPKNAVRSFSIDRNYNENGKIYFVFTFIYDNKDYSYIISPSDGSILSPRKGVVTAEDFKMLEN